MMYICVIYVSSLVWRRMQHARLLGSEENIQFCIRSKRIRHPDKLEETEADPEEYFPQTLH
jgi:hypothetical protein